MNPSNKELAVKTALILLIAAFLLIRNGFTAHYKKATPKTSIKYLILLPLLALYLFGFLDFALLPLNNIFRFSIGPLLIILGFSLFFWSHKSLGKNWSPVIEKRFSKDRNFIKTGPYKHIRHPIYTASIIMLLGFGLFSANGLLFAASMIILLLFYSRKVPKEEEELIRNFGKKYKSYINSTGKFLPKLG